AYAAGDLNAARTAYEEALREEPSNRDALLGLAALELRSARYESAEGLYLRALQSDPRDGDTQAALIALRSGRSDPLVTESRVKSLIAAEPTAHALHFTLGNQLAAQNRWAEAQQEYFKAYVADSDNADLAYNLAVSLDHLHQRRQALEYYQRAISLGEKRGAGFDLASARAPWRGAIASSRWRSTAARRSSSSRSPTRTTSSRSTSCARISRAITSSSCASPATRKSSARSSITTATSSRSTAS